MVPCHIPVHVHVHAVDQLTSWRVVTHAFSYLRESARTLGSDRSQAWYQGKCRYLYLARFGGTPDRLLVIVSAAMQELIYL